MKKRLFLFSLVFLLLVGLVSAVDFDSQLVCGSNPNSAVGYGAVSLCNTFYACGVSDGVCPEDFYSSANSLRGSCMNCPDVDCTVEVSGHVYLLDGVTPIPSATVYQTNEAEGFTNLSTTNADGEFSVIATSGRTRFYAAYKDFDSKIVSVLLKRGRSVNNITILMSPGACTPDCTDVFGSVCKASCNGVDGCAFPNDATTYISSYTSKRVATLCDGYFPGTRLRVDESDDNITYAICCNDSVNQPFIQVESRPKLSTLERGDNKCIKDLGTYVVKAKYRGQTVKVVAKSWQSSCTE